MVRGKSYQYKFMWQGWPDGNHDVGVLVSDEFVDNVADMKLVSEHLMIVTGKCLINLI